MKIFLILFLFASYTISAQIIDEVMQNSSGINMNRNLEISEQLYNSDPIEEANDDYKSGIVRIISLSLFEEEIPGIDIDLKGRKELENIRLVYIIDIKTDRAPKEFIQLIDELRKYLSVYNKKMLEMIKNENSPTKRST